LQRWSPTLRKTFAFLPLLAQTLVLMLVCTTPAVAAPTAAAPPGTRTQVQMGRDEFLRTHRWDPLSDVWTLNSGVEPPTGVMPRADVRAARDAYLATHRWDEARGWRPLAAAPRNLSAMPREQVKAETRQFLRTHRWDEAAEEWVPRNTRPPGR
jgi:hypothetical protein